ncbi:dTDP-4-dehydrorhamnose reductase [Sphingobacterium phlebotomi]|uniref:dTDP-4-dehydrorhamnose reductase n=1 Tax=Sphingobacterium phlebotomi TaxID=2605433 RepID=A0A5D4H7S5_9SPHI|nr:dTDP-4-dehydrorhamnose reductase [Sphingobacterium phlebotomi]TYR36826.1 dTDP-4-dehydrorhamnose reductase [Sphingobacterium phlebotomi]
MSLHHNNESGTTSYKQRILVTGANGQVGSELKELLGKEDFEVFFLDRKQLPLEQTLIIQDILGMYEPDIIIHAAAYTAVDKAESEPELADAVNHLATEEIAQYCRLHGAKLLAISTDYVFDGHSSEPLTEDSATAPLNIYGLTKWKGEQAIQKWAPESVIIRTSWVYAAYGNNFVKTMIRLMHEREELSVVHDQIGSPTYARDIAQAIVDIIKAATWHPGIYHYSNEGQLSWYDFAVAIRDLIGATCHISPISTSQYPTPAKRPAYSLLDKTKIKDTFGVKVPSWQESLSTCIDRIK